jgi:hypothetical protein
MARIMSAIAQSRLDENQIQGDLGGPPSPSHCDLMPRGFARRNHQNDKSVASRD